MEIKVEVKLVGLEPLVEAITMLAKGYGASNAAVDKVVEKAKGRTASKVSDSEVGKPANDVKDQASSSAEQASTSPASVTQSSTSDLEVGKPVQPATETESSSPSTTNSSDASATSASGSITDEALRLAAAAKARINKEKTKAIVMKFAESVTLIPADQREAFLKELEEVAA